ncbi:MAG: hypothetical protein JSW37_10890 [Anaerolineales bacterium]|nr:MAG: hypothetical protein JSW37_10890 [Anaerolineales bacterium]
MSAQVSATGSGSGTAPAGEHNVLCFDFYGLRIAVHSENEGVLEDVQRDFSYFRAAPGHTHSRLEIVPETPAWADLPALPATLHTPRNIVYRDGNLSYLDYSGRALMIVHHDQNRYRVYCVERDLAHEIAFLTMLSRAGEYLDSIGLHRVHALGVQASERATLILLPMGGGKTTLAMRVLGSQVIKLLSEDSPLVSRSGQVYPFPIRIGVRAGEEPPDAAAGYCRTVQRMEFGPKTLIDIAHFAQQIGQPCPIGSILLGERWLTGDPFIRPASRRAAIGPLIKNSVVGLGLYQGVEFVLERSAWEILGKAGLAGSRLLTSLQLVRRAQVYRFGLGPDVRQNAEMLIRFLVGQPSDRR